jgi:hypothetical protein
MEFKFGDSAAISEILGNSRVQIKRYAAIFTEKDDVSVRYIR